MAKFGDLMSCGSKDILKKHLVPCNNTHHDVTDLANHGMAKNTETWISPERNITFLWNKKSLTYASDDTFLKVIVL